MSHVSASSIFTPKDLPDVTLRTLASPIWSDGQDIQEDLCHKRGKPRSRGVEFCTLSTIRLLLLKMGGEQNTWQPWYQWHPAQESERNKYLGSISKRITAQRKRDNNKDTES